MPTPLSDDPVLRAHFRRQRDWATDAPELMAGKTARETRRDALLAALDRRDNERRKAVNPRKRKTPTRSPAAKPAARRRAAAKTAPKTTKSKTATRTTITRTSTGKK